jgi:uncharacterized OB-fold protein
MAASGYVLPGLEDPAARPFWDGTARGELLIQTCADCGVLRMPPRPMCPACRSIGVRWTKASGRGRVWSYVVAHPPLLPAYAEHAPYPVIVVELEEDPTLRLVGNFVASADAPINSVDPATIRIGEPVRVVFTQIDDVALPRWVRASAAA